MKLLHNVLICFYCFSNKFIFVPFARDFVKLLSLQSTFILRSGYSSGNRVNKTYLPSCLFEPSLTLKMPFYYVHGRRLCRNRFRHGSTIISYPQCSLTFLHERYLHKCREQSFAIRAYAMSAVCIDVVSRHTKCCRIASQNSRMHCKVQMNEWPLILWRFNCISTKE